MTTKTSDQSGKASHIDRAHGRRIPKETWDWVRRRVETSGVPIAQISRETGVPASSITSRIRREGWLRKAQLSAELAQAEPEERGRLIARLYNAFEKQVGRIEARLKELSAEESVSLAETDHLSRALTSLAKTLDTLISLQDAHSPDAQEAEEPDDHLRDQLAKRLAHLCEAGQG
ncbi:hypothetical protein [Pseudovibrio sp. SPO723]|uniref:hypothetical protein n=1 Tax=Nesiotobacter zosterae TaxID=392721 RepID=UPI0029C20ECE|nr:hypothetical protein [Pseudovibrio sp. SPO723]MDX5595595.1 hypothetical protein [Pseudovibrio sp. SPO723]